jgi:hypothetical protein
MTARWLVSSSRICNRKLQVAVDDVGDLECGDLLQPLYSSIISPQKRARMLARKHAHSRKRVIFVTGGIEAR